MNAILMEGLCGPRFQLTQLGVMKPSIFSADYRAASAREGQSAYSV